MTVALGIDIGGSSIKLAALRGDEVIWTAQSGKYDHPSREELAGTLRAAIAGGAGWGAGAGGGVGGAEVVGLCVPGARDRGGRVVKLSVNLPALNGLGLDELIMECVEGEVRHLEVASDAVAGGYDLYVTRKLAGRGRLLVLSIGTGVGAAVLDEGVPLLVEGESPGHIGQMDVSIEGHPVVGADGGAGSLEGYISAAALAARFGPDTSAALRALLPDDPALRALARAIRIGHAIYRPDHVALAGGMGIRMKHLLPAIRALVDDKLTGIARKDWTLFSGDDDYHAARGIARMAQAARARGKRED